MKLNLRNDTIGFGTNVLDIEVPDQLRNKIKSGLEFMDGALGGEGFTPSQVVLFTGTPGAGKTTMLLTMADRLTKAGCTVVFNTAEESLFQVKLIAERLGLKSGFSVGQETHVPTLLTKCDALRKKSPTKPFFILVDSLQCMDDGHYDDGSINSRSADRSLQLITDWCKANYTNGIVIGQVNKAGKMAGAAFLRNAVEVFPYKIHIVLTDNGMAFADLPKNRDRPSTRLLGPHIFDRVCIEHGIEHRLTKPYHPWTNGQAERMNRTIKDATVKVYHYDDLKSLKAHVLAFVTAYNFAKHLKALRWRTPYQVICETWTKAPSIFKIDPHHLIPGPHT
jgi:hypothetical protein